MRRIDDRAHPLVDRFQDFVRRPDFPCVGAKSAVGRGQMKFVVARDIMSSWDDLKIYVALLEFATSYRADRRLFQSLVVLFETTGAISESSFEQAMWTRIQSLSDKDAWHGQNYDDRVAPTPKVHIFR